MHTHKLHACYRRYYILGCPFSEAIVQSVTSTCKQWPSGFVSYEEVEEMGVHRSFSSFYDWYQITQVRLVGSSPASHVSQSVKLDIPKGTVLQRSFCTCILKTATRQDRAELFCFLCKFKAKILGQTCSIQCNELRTGRPPPKDAQCVWTEHTQTTRHWHKITRHKNITRVKRLETAEGSEDGYLLLLWSIGQWLRITDVDQPALRVTPGHYRPSRAIFHRRRERVACSGIALWQKDFRPLGRFVFRSGKEADLPWPEWHLQASNVLQDSYPYWESISRGKAQTFVKASVASPTACRPRGNQYKSEVTVQRTSIILQQNKKKHFWSRWKHKMVHHIPRKLFFCERWSTAGSWKF